MSDSSATARFESAAREGGLVEFEVGGITMQIIPAGEGSFVAVADGLAKALGARSTKDLTRSISDEYKGGHVVPTPGGPQRKTTISEPGVYEALTRSRSPLAKPIQKKLFEEILPAIRKAGRYELAPQSPAEVIAAGWKLLEGQVEDERRGRLLAEATVEDQAAIQVLLGAAYASLLPDAGTCVQVRLTEVEGAGRLVDAKFTGGRGQAGRTGILEIVVEATGGTVDLHRWSGLDPPGAFFARHEVEEDVQAPDLQLVELDSGVAIRSAASDDATIVLEKPGSNGGRTIRDPAIAGARLFSDGGQLLMAQGARVFRASLR